MDIQALQAARLAGTDQKDAFADRPTVLKLTEVTKVFGTKKDPFTAVAGVDLTVRDGEFLSILGPAGCGKTTLMRLIAGLDIPNPGTILIDGTDCSRWPAHRRQVNTIFKDFALFPHMRRVRILVSGCGCSGKATMTSPGK